ncbi:MAG: SurA N-terminal domain-containing protein [Candidatus Omnitrophica bacterium]|nr:SurA N-terminal domain-containing protein [Candidatus Omnitrophota bacterium]
MLEVMRKKGVNKTILWIIAVVVILSFGVFGTAYRMDNSFNSAGTMYGHNVSIKDFQQAYDDARDQAIRVYGDEFFKNGNKIDLEQETWDRMVLLKEAQKRNIHASDQEVVAYIATFPFFQRDGQFDQMRYEEIVQNSRVFNRSTHDFEEGVRKQLIIKKLIDNVAPDTILSDAELKKIYQKRNEKLTLQYVLFNASDYAKNATASEDEINKFYEQRKEQFRLPPTIVLNYVQAKDKALADTLSKMLKPGSDFASVANQLKLEVKTSVPFTQDQPILTFASNPDNIQKFFAMKPGEYSPALEAPDGWQIVQLKEKNSSAIPTLQDSKDRVKEALLLEKGFALAKPQADKSLKELSNALKSKDFKTAATEIGLKVEETPAFGRKEYIANTGLIQEFQQETDMLNTDKRLSEVISTSQGPAIIYLKKMEKPEDGQFESDKSNFRQMLSAEKRNQILIAFMSQLRAKADVQSKIKHQ